MKQLFLYLGATALFIAAVGFYTSKSQGRTISILPVKSPKPAETKIIKVADKELNVSLANNPEKRKIGLSQTKSLTDGEGMLFSFDGQNSKPAFWMKNMSMDIDIIWINDSKIVQIDENVKAPPPGTADRELKLYQPDQPIDFVLEVAAGWSQRNSIKVGDQITL